MNYINLQGNDTKLLMPSLKGHCNACHHAPSPYLAGIVALSALMPLAVSADDAVSAGAVVVITMPTWRMLITPMRSMPPRC